ncbi:MAG: heme ABC transporter ATP-binding protein [Verrucomicrobiota bacterium]
MNSPASQTGVLEARDVTVRAGRKVLIEDINFTLKPGALDVIVGPNGAGKSTLLKALTGENQPDAGTVTLDGKALGEYNSVELATRRACLPQSSTLSFPFTIREVVSIGRHPHRESDTATREAVEHSLNKVGLLSRIDEGYLHLSGGEKQRVHLARILAQLEEPEGRILLLDEPTASLDLTFQQLVFSIAEEWASSGASVLLVLHDLNQAMRYAKSVTVLHRGRVVRQGPPSEVLTRKLLRDVYEVNARWIDTDEHRLLAVDGPEK